MCMSEEEKGAASLGNCCTFRVGVEGSWCLVIFLILTPFLPHPYTGRFHFLTTFPPVHQPSPIWLLFQSLYCLHYCKATDDLRKRMKAIDVLSAKSYRHLSGLILLGSSGKTRFLPRSPLLLMACAFRLRVPSG